VGYVVDEKTVAHDFSKRFGFPLPIIVPRMLRDHSTSGACVIWQFEVVVPSDCLTPLLRLKMKLSKSFGIFLEKVPPVYGTQTNPVHTPSITSLPSLF
jgi:hypothetical protein